MRPGERFANPLTERLVAFVRSIGVAVRAATRSHKILRRLEIRDGAILVDAARSLYPGDILREAGHPAVADPAERDAPLRFDVISAAGREWPPRRASPPFPHMLRRLR